MTVRLSATFEDQMRDIMQSWKAAKRRESHTARLSKDFVSIGNGVGSRSYGTDSDASEASDQEDSLDDPHDEALDDDYETESKVAVKKNGKSPAAPLGFIP